MTSPAFFLLSLGLVCSIIGTTSELRADHNNRQSIMKRFMTHDKEHTDTDPNMESRTNVRVNSIRNYVSYDENNIELKTVNQFNANVGFDEIYTGDEDGSTKSLDMHRMNLKRFDEEDRVRKFEGKKWEIRGGKMDLKRRVKRQDEDPRCKYFNFNDMDIHNIWHPHATDSDTYYNSTKCVTVISAPEGQVIELTFIDIFRIEYHPDCAYDYLEIRDGLRGYSKLLKKVCGQAFPQQVITTGPYAWLKFQSDDTIEYEGFHIKIDFKTGPSHRIPDSCFSPVEGMFGNIASKNIDPSCISGSIGHDLDVLWMITSPPNTKIYLNFTTYELAKPNECHENIIQVFGSVLEEGSKLGYFCGSMATSVTTKDDSESKETGNIMHVRLFTTKSAKKDTKFNATFTAYRTLEPSKDEKCTDNEFDCEDNTCISLGLKCNHEANCRLKADEDVELCKDEAESMIKQPHILAILVIFSLILSGMTFVFLFKCISKLYKDHKLIKEHIRQSCEDRLDSLVERRLTLDAQRLQRDSEPRASLERENHTNEMFKRQRSYSKNRPTSIDSDYIQETHLDLDEEPWRREVDNIPVETVEDVRIERNGRTRRSDMSKKEESIRSKRKESEDSRMKKEIRDASVGAPDTKESGCQTRESLFQTEPPPSSDGSGTNSRGFSTFGYSGATIVRPSTPAQTNTSEITIELLSQVPRQDSAKPQKKIPDRRPMSTETTRSAPDVIIVSKPIR